MDFFGTNFNKTFSLPFYIAISSGEVKNMGVEDKFWEAPSIQASETNIDIREQGLEYTFSTTADIDTLSSDSTDDINILLEIEGLDLEGNTLKGYAWLNGQNKVLVYSNTNLTGDTISFWRVHRMQVVSWEVEGTTAKNIAGNVYFYVDTTINTGTPTDTSKIRAKIVNGNNQTQMAIYTIPKGYTWYLIQGDMSMSRPQSSTATAVTHYKSRRKGGVFKIKKTIGLQSAGTSYFKDIRTIPDIIPPLTDIKLSCKSVSANDTGIAGGFQIVLIKDSRFN